MNFVHGIVEHAGCLFKEINLQHDFGQDATMVLVVDGHVRPREDSRSQARRANPAPTRKVDGCPNGLVGTDNIPYMTTVVILEDSCHARDSASRRESEPVGGGR